MKGLELSRKYYETYGKPMLEEEFPDYVPRIAVGLAGEGSECFGFDDDISTDHDFGPSFCLWLTDEDYAAIGEKLAADYAKLPAEFEGVRFENASAYGDGRRGVMRTGDFYEKLTGSRNGQFSWQDFLFVPDYSFATAVNGQVFTDPLGEFSAIRERIKTAMPEDIRLKKIAARAASMAQSGQYNFSRCQKHGETAAAAVALSEFAKQTVMMVFLLNRQYCPYYKWMFRAMKELPLLSGLSADLEWLLAEENKDGTIALKIDRIEKISAAVIGELKRQNLTDGDWDYLEPHAFSVMMRIQDGQIRALHVMQG
jgi:hypothetical protein